MHVDTELLDAIADGIEMATAPLHTRITALEARAVVLERDRAELQSTLELLQDKAMKWAEDYNPSRSSYSKGDVVRKHGWYIAERSHPPGRPGEGPLSGWKLIMKDPR